MTPFWRFNAAEGRGVSKEATQRTGLSLVLDVVGREAFELVKLNLLFLFVSLPLVTVPAAMVGMIRVCRTMAQDRPRDLVREFFVGMRSRAVAATLAGIVLIAAEVVAVVALASYARASVDDLVFVMPVAVSLTVAIAVPLYGMALFVLLAMSDLPLPALVRPAGLALLLHPGRMLAALAIIAGLWITHVLFYPVSVLMPVLINFSFGALAMVFGAHDGGILALSVEETPTARVRDLNGGSSIRLLWRT